MSLARIHRKDANQDEIVAALRKAGVLCWVIGRPCDLLTWRPWLGMQGWLPMELKDPKARKRKDQQEQSEFLERTGVPVVRSLDEALVVLGCKSFLQVM